MVYIYDQSEAIRLGAQLDESVYHLGIVRYILTDKRHYSCHNGEVSEA